MSATLPPPVTFEYDEGYMSEESIEEGVREAEGQRPVRIPLGEMPPVDYSSSRSVSPELREAEEMGLIKPDGPPAALASLPSPSSALPSGMSTPEPGSMSPLAGIDIAAKPTFAEPFSPSSFARAGDFMTICGRRVPAIFAAGSPVSSAFTVAASMLGAGTLALPMAMRNAGLLLGPVLLVTCCIPSVFSIKLLVTLVEKTGLTSYEKLARGLVGPRFEKLTVVLIVSFCWGITVLYVVAIGSILEPLTMAKGMPRALQTVWGRRGIVCLFWMLFMLPLSLMREISSLRYASIISMSSVLFLTVAIVTHAEQNEPAAVQVPLAQFNLNLIMAMPIFIFAYCCQTSTFIIYEALKKHNPLRMTRIVSGTMVFVTGVYICIGIAGAVNFGTETRGIILENYADPIGTPYLAAAFVGIAVTITMAFPLCIFPTRDAILQLMGFTSIYSTPTWVRVTLCAGLASGSLVLGLFWPGVQILFGILGGICGSCLSYIWPAVFALRTKDWNVATVGRFNIVFTYALLISGILAGMMSTALSIYELVA